MLTVYALPGAWDLPSVSPYCTKLLWFLELAGIEHEVVAGDLRESPCGKVPYIDHDGLVMGDTHAIIRYLVDKTGKGLPDDLTTEQRSRCHAAMRIAEDSLYWALVYSRWVREEGWAQLRPNVEAMLPALLRPIVTPLIRRSALKQLHQVGISRLTPDEIWGRAARDLDALEGLLGDEPFLGGDEPTVYDVAVCAVLGSILIPPVPSPIKEAADRPGLRGWLERFSARLA